MEPRPIHPRTIFAEDYEVAARLAALGLTSSFLARCAAEGDIDRRSAPPFGFEGHPEYNAGSRIISAMCEYGGETDGAWRRGNLHRIQVVFNYDESVAIHPTSGTEGTGQRDGDPHNRSLKGPYSARAASRPLTLGVEFDVRPPDFYWFFTRRDDLGLWAELYQPVVAADGTCTDFAERILLGNIAGPTQPVRRAQPDDPISPADIDISRRAS